MAKVTPHVSVESFPPGEFIRDEMEARGWTQDDLASVLGLSRRQVVNLINGKSGITPPVAQALAQAFGHEAQTWLNLQASYELSQLADKGDEIARRAKVFQKIPVRDVARRGWITMRDDIVDLEREICCFLGIDCIDQEPRIAVAARKSMTYALDTPAQTAWYVRAQRLAATLQVQPYHDSAVEGGIRELLSLTARAEDVQHVPAVLSNMGVRLVLIEHLPHTKIDGVAFWIDDVSPVIALSLRYDRIDYFWFTLLHELVHIKYRDRSTVDVDVSELGEGEVPRCEERANREAAHYLIDPDKMQSFVLRNRPLYYQKSILQFASLQKVHPGIVVGQLHRRKEMKYSQLRGLLEKVRHYIVGKALTDGWGNSPNIG